MSFVSSNVSSASISCLLLNKGDSLIAFIFLLRDDARDNLQGDGGGSSISRKATEASVSPLWRLVDGRCRCNARFAKSINQYPLTVPLPYSSKQTSSLSNLIQGPYAGLNSIKIEAYQILKCTLTSVKVNLRAS